MSIWITRGCRMPVHSRFASSRRSTQPHQRRPDAHQAKVNRVHQFSNQPHCCYGNSRATCDHTVLPATFPSRLQLVLHSATPEGCEAELTDLFHFVNTLRFRRGAVQEAGQQMQSTAVRRVGDGSRGHVTSDVIEDHLAAWQWQGASDAVVRVKHLGQNTMTAIVELGVRRCTAVIRCPSNHNNFMYKWTNFWEHCKWDRHRQTDKRITILLNAPTTIGRSLGGNKLLTNWFLWL